MSDAWRRPWLWLSTYAATLAGGFTILAGLTGWHPRLVDIALAVAGTLGSSAVHRVVYRRPARRALGTPTDHYGEPDYEVAPGFAPEVVALVGQGRKIQAIKRYRRLNPGTGLKEAKDAIDGLVASWGR